MSATAKSLLASVLLLGMAVGGATPASAQTDTPRGIWVKIDAYRAWTLTIVNLTSEPLALVAQAVTTTGGQRPPFHGTTLNDEAAFPLAPYQNVTWKSNTATPLYPHPRWNGVLAVLPQGMDPKWKATLNFREHYFIDCAENCVEAYGTWVYLTADHAANPDWQDPDPTNLSCSYPAYYDSTYNVMTLSGTDLVASLYAPYVNINQAPTVNITLAIRQRRTDEPIPVAERIVAPCLTYQDNNGKW